MIRLRRTLALFSSLLNVVFLGGRPGEMTSTKIYRLAVRGNRVASFFKPLLDWVFWEKNHCFNCLLTDRRRARELLDELHSDD